MSESEPLKTICIIYTGGTIGMIREPVDDGFVLKPPRDATTFSKIAPPEISQLANIHYEYLDNIDSTNMTPIHWARMAKKVYELMDRFDGFVIAHGTDTMHFSASALAFAFGKNLNKPVVFTGAQTDASVLHGDARINLIRAVLVATTAIAEVVICFNNNVFRGCRTQKRDERRFDAFESPAFWPIADITEEVIIHPTARKRLPETISAKQPIDFQPDFESNIFQISLIPGLRPEFLNILLEPSTCDGVVLQSFGAGNVPNIGEYSFENFIRLATDRHIPVIVASQFPANSTVDTDYEPGRDAIKAGAIPTGNMTNAAATAKFRWLLARVRKQGLVGADKMLAIETQMAEPQVGEMDNVSRRNHRRTADERGA